MSDAARTDLEPLDRPADSLVRGWAGEVAPTLADKTVSFVFGEVYALQHLPARYRELVITAVLAATGALPDGMVEHAWERLFSFMSSAHGAWHAIGAPWERTSPRG